MEDNQRSRFRKICVFCGSHSGHREVFSDAAIELGNELVCSLSLFSSSFDCFLFGFVIKIWTFLQINTDITFARFLNVKIRTF